MAEADALALVAIARRDLQAAHGMTDTTTFHEAVWGFQVQQTIELSRSPQEPRAHQLRPPMARTTSCRSCCSSARLIRESVAALIRVLAMQVSCWGRR